jgi:hypothetical protein
MAVEMTLVFQFMLMLVSLYGLKMSEAGAVPVLPPELDPPPPPELELELLLDEPPLDDPLPDDEPLPPGHVAPPGSHPVPQLVTAQW